MAKKKGKIKDKKLFFSALFVIIVLITLFVLVWRAVNPKKTIGQPEAAGCTQRNDRGVCTEYFTNGIRYTYDSDLDDDGPSNEGGYSAMGSIKTDADGKNYVETFQLDSGAKYIGGSWRKNYLTSETYSGPVEYRGESGAEEHDSIGPDTPEMVGNPNRIEYDMPELIKMSGTSYDSSSGSENISLWGRIVRTLSRISFGGK